MCCNVIVLSVEKGREPDIIMAPLFFCVEKFEEENSVFLKLSQMGNIYVRHIIKHLSWSSPK